MSATPEAFYPRKSSPPDPTSFPLSLRTCCRVLGAVVALVVLVSAVQGWRGRNHEYQRMVSENKAMALALGTCQGEKRPTTPAGFYFFGTLGAFELYAREKTPARVASR